MEVFISYSTFGLQKSDYPQTSAFLMW